MAQNYNNEWINYNQQYFQIPITEEGIYKIDYNTLIGVGFPVNSIDPRNIQLFREGKEQPLFIKGENDGIFNNNDFILFYGNRNDGKLDSYLYKQPQWQLNIHQSLFTDTAMYFLTFNTSSPNPDGTSSNLRFKIEQVFDTTGLIKEPYCFVRNIESYRNDYFYGEIDANRKSRSEYTMSEGWGERVSYGNARLKVLRSENAIRNLNLEAEAWITIAGASNASSNNYDHHLKIMIGQEWMIDTFFYDFSLLNIYRKFDCNKLDNEYTNFYFYIPNDLQLASDHCAIAWIMLRYPRNFDFQNNNSGKFELEPNQNPYRFIQLKNIGQNNDSILLFDLTNNKLLPVFRYGNILKTVSSKITSTSVFYFTTQNYIKNISKIRPVSSSMQSSFAKFFNFTSPNNRKYDYIIITSRELYPTVISEYQNYRNLTGYKVLTIDIEELYNQFSYGIKKHPLAIRNFMKYCFENFDSIPKYLFLIGKALKPEVFRNNPTYFRKTLVPSFGTPPSDILFTAGLDGDNIKPAIPVGRLSASTPYHVILYKNKVQSYEASLQNPSEHHKRVIHFGGGKNIYEQNYIRNYLNIYKNYIVSPYFGGKVFTFLKTSSAPVQITTSDSIRNLINSGVGMITFFGHAAGSGFDMDIEKPSDWTNSGKYPFVLALSCLSGDMFEVSTTNTEEFVLTEDRGAVGYLGSTSLGIAPYLNIYATKLHENICLTNYGNSIGNHIKNTIDSIQNTNNVNIIDVCLEMGLHSDPAIKIASFPKPDYYISSNNIFTNPPEVTTESSQFELKVISKNLGKAVLDSFTVEVKRILPDGINFEYYYYTGPSTIYIDTITFNIPVNFVNGVGMNKFIITLDARNRIDELSEYNNTTEVTILIKSTDIFPILPYKYAIIPTNKTTLYACTSDPLISPRNYIFEIDTNDSFNPNSPFYRKQIIHSPGGIITWTPDITFADSMVYYWRVAPEQSNTGIHKWRESSFQYIKDKRGWGQAHYFQFKNNNYTYVKFNRPNRNFIFENDMILITTQNTYNTYDWTNIWYRVNNYQNHVGTWVLDGVVAVAFNNVNGNPMINITGNDYGSYSGNPPRPNVPYFEFNTTTTSGMLALENFLSNVVPQNYYVLLYSARNHNAQNYPPTLYATIENIGSQYIRNIPNNRPFIIFGKKGYTPGMAHETIGANTVDHILQNDTIITSWKEGSILSEIVGPASKWKSLHWRVSSYETPSTDSVALFVIGLKNNGQNDTLLYNIPTSQGDIYNLDNVINYSEYPMLKLLCKMSDDSMRTPSQITRWQVMYEGIPETAIDPTVNFSFYKNNIDEGDLIKLSISTRNISEYDMDSLKVKYWIVDKNRNISQLKIKKLRKHPAGDVLTDTVVFSTRGLSGHNTLWAEFNPDNDQPEQHHFNNYISIPFNVISDKQNPLLDVTFDGIHILDGDIVSAKPLIQIQLKDENRFIFPTELKDTALFKVYIQYPNTSEPKRIYFNINGKENMRFYPATPSENICRIEYPAHFPIDGKYKLIVQARDKAGNLSGDYDYTINFEVINKPTITHLLNWPNPFSTRTHFVFTITGSTVPDFFKIRIYTITGKLVREIDGSELGNLHIGRNVTQYAWDGKDQYGDQLANGVYLYKVIAKINGQEIEHRETSIDKYFIKDFGKMVLIR